ncbi:hypothetical protein PsYK624_118640 [Phanerochaete sordida]|uniref:Uncharacterized protein n=1 Tax=Phanerochaete sordida TaxID=48140 RepID=A0A9P3GIR4_9APHY|nr:hypothetical protein PsYK624_118640 [Phanerochaete sordida]
MHSPAVLRTLIVFVALLLRPALLCAAAPLTFAGIEPPQLASPVNGAPGINNVETGLRPANPGDTFARSVRSESHVMWGA